MYNIAGSPICGLAKMWTCAMCMAQVVNIQYSRIIFSVPVPGDPARLSSAVHTESARGVR